MGSRASTRGGDRPNSSNVGPDPGEDLDDEYAKQSDRYSMRMGRSVGLRRCRDMDMDMDMGI